MRRRLFPCVLFSALAVVSTAAAKPASWALPQIKLVLAHDLMGAQDPASFRPADPLTRGALENLAAALAPAPPTTASAAPAPAKAAPATVANADQPVTMAQLDARLVQMVGLSDVASQFARSARTAGLKVPGRFGTEVTARLLGLRLNHPAVQDTLELLPDQPATRAEAAYSVAQILFEPSPWAFMMLRALGEVCHICDHALQAANESPCG